jgi:hypothetical protein
LHAIVLFRILIGDFGVPFKRLPAGTAQRKRCLETGPVHPQALPGKVAIPRRSMTSQ